MPARGAEFLEIVLGDRKAVEELDHFLIEREGLLAEALWLALDSENALKKNGVFAGITAVLPPLEKAIASKNEQPSWTKTTVIRQMNEALWEHVELLEGCIRELFAQISGIGIDNWLSILRETVVGFEQVLLQHLDAVEKTVERLEASFHGPSTLRSLLHTVAQRWLRRDLRLDRALVPSIHHSKKLLESHYSLFIEQYTEHQKRTELVNEQAQKLKDYEILKTLDTSAVDEFLSLYRLVRWWENSNRKRESIPLELSVALKKLSRDKTYFLLRHYYQLLEETLFDKSRTIKTAPTELFSDVRGRAFFTETLQALSHEVHTLGFTISRYRELILRTDANPYVRARWNFYDTFAGPEPKYTAKLTELNYQVEELNSLYKHLYRALEQGPGHEKRELFLQLKDEIESSLHLIGQPLIPLHLFHKGAEKILQKLDSLDELGSYGQESLNYVRHVLDRLLRANWSGHPLFEIPLFLQLYNLHQKIIGPSADEAHRQRLLKLDILLEQIRQKISDENTLTNQGIDYDLNDIKGYLQDFLATLQRSLKDDTASAKRAKQHAEDAAQQLLEYRYLFGFFLAKLHTYTDIDYLYHQLLFVDHYFESIEDKIYTFLTHHPA